MNKKQIFELLWTDVTKRLPKTNTFEFVLTWNDKCKDFVRYPADGVVNSVNRRLNGEEPKDKFEAEDYSAFWVTHWTYVFPPANKRFFNQQIKRVI